MKLLLVDTSPDWLATVRQALARALPDLEVSEYDAEQQGTPGPDFDWSLYDVAFIGHAPTAGLDGLAWLRRFGARPEFPPAVLVAIGGDDYLAAAALKAGARDYLRRDDAAGVRAVEFLRATGTRPAPDATLHLPDTARRAPERTAALGLPLVDDTGHRFVRLIGQGGFSRVYLAERADDGMLVVLKVLDRRQVREPSVMARFAREAAIIAAIDDPRVVRIHGHGVTPDYGYLALEFFAGGDLKRRIERGMTAAQAVHCMREIARGLQAVHAHDVVHRDLKPGNIMFRADDSLALADFGISKRRSDDRDLTRETGVVGTPSYLSPEQALGAEPDPRSDLYSAGIVFYELLTGHKPFRAECASSLVYQHLHAPPPRLPAALAVAQPVIDILLAKRPEERFASAGELLTALDDWLPPAPDEDARLAA